MRSNRDSKASTKNILVTGGAGFLGINLIRHLLDRDYTSITSLDIAEFDYPEKDRIRAVKGDIRDFQLVRDLVPGTDWLIHAAAPGRSFHLHLLDCRLRSSRQLPDL